MVAGPFTTFEIGDGKRADLYLLRYDTDGRALSPQTDQMFRSSLAGVTDVFVFSHGWNNTFEAASRNYRQFIEGYIGQRAEFGLPLPPDYKPALVGVIWPSTSFLFPWEGGPDIAADSGADAARLEEMLRLIADNLEPGAAADLVEIIDGRDELTEEDARTAAEIMVNGLGGTDPGEGSPPPQVDDVLKAWAALDGSAAKPADPDDFGGLERGGAAGPRPAGFLGAFDPRNVLRMGTVWLMKDRAGKVGAHGVAPLVQHILGTPARLHLIGHSFGARVVLSSLAVGGVDKAARSMLLLQPAINRWCFAADVIGTGRPGGYRPALDRVELPILSTFSKHDVPLTQAFHLAVRGSSLGEPDIAAVGDTDRYGALGGYGPAGIDAQLDKEDAIAAGASTYQFRPGKEVVALNGGIDIQGRPAIGGHGDINNPTTWWALHCLTAAP
jgi:hypothetical protein